MKDKIIDILKYVWNPKFDLNNEYEYQHLNDMTNFILDALNDDQREVKISEFLKRNSIKNYQGEISPDKSDSVTSLILGWAYPLKKVGEAFAQTTSVFSLYSDQELPNNFSYPSPEAAQFLWLPSMSEADPLYILPVLSAFTTFLQQKMTTTEMNQQMKIMMTVMPIFIGWISLTFPSGLVLYWVTMNVVQIAQQWWMYRGEGTKKEAA